LGIVSALLPTRLEAGVNTTTTLHFVALKDLVL
jgi:hypothetical protein